MPAPCLEVRNDSRSGEHEWVEAALLPGVFVWHPGRVEVRERMEAEDMRITDRSVVELDLSEAKQELLEKILATPDVTPDDVGEPALGA